MQGASPWFDFVFWCEAETLNPKNGPIVGSRFFVLDT
uniref:Uncharacterized protein n=1 Tax=Anguilla anguilla TaxID=7936 RepID=A0A0E9QW38_ANGAN